MEKHTLDKFNYKNLSDCYNNSILEIGQSDSVPAKDFGLKAHNLHLVAQRENCIPRAFTINYETVHDLSVGRYNEKIITILKSFFDNLLTHSLSKKIIVRSSSILEDVADHQFPGIFKSVFNVIDFESLLNAIRFCYESSKTDVVAKFCKKFDIHLPPQHMAVIVQEQIVCDYSAIVQLQRDGCIIELYKGQLTGPISGNGTPTRIELSYTSKGNIFWSNRPQNINAVILTNISKNLVPLVQRLRMLSSLPIVLEIGFNTDDLFIFQLRYVKQSQSLQLNDVTTYSSNTSNFLPKQDEIGLKAAAMEFFKDRGLFNLPIFISKPPIDPRRFDQIFNDQEGFNGPFTIRFSYQTELGLPRLFVRKREDILPAVLKHHKSNWSIVIHKFIDVRRSFELLLSHSMILLEHVPGMWESDNKLPPDVLQINGSRIKTWLWKKHRKANVASFDQMETIIYPPVTSEQIKQWASRLIKIVNSLKTTLESNFPLNIHFVEDKAGEWFFLNIRPGFPMLNPVIVTSPVHVVKKSEHLLSWDGKSSLLLKLYTNRGREKDLLPLIEKLPRNKIDIFIDAGILSHPAMVLREYGINVVPSYMAYPPLKNLNYYKEDVFEYRYR